MRYRSTGLLVAVAAASLIVAGCGSGGSSGTAKGSGHVITEQRPIPAFQRVELAGEGRLIMSPDGPAALEVRIDDNLMAFIDTSVTDGRLVISTRPDTDLVPSSEVTYRVRCDQLSEVLLTGSGQIEVAKCPTDDMAIGLDGSGDIRVAGIDAASVNAELGGSGNIAATGRSSHVAASIAGSGTFDGTALEASTVEARIPGSGQITVWATSTLEASISGSGSVRYRGHPTVTQDVTGSGSVTQMNDG